MNIRMAALAACIAALGGSPAQADIIQADFTGVFSSTQNGFFNLNGQTFPYSTLFGVSFTAAFEFDTARGVLSKPSPGINELTGGLISASFEIPSIGYSKNTVFADIAILEWSDDFATASAEANYLARMFKIDLFTALPFYQAGPCPGEPCGRLRTDSVFVSNLGPSPVPVPVAGAGLPGLMLAIGALLRWRRRTRQTCK